MRTPAQGAADLPAIGTASRHIIEHARREERTMLSEVQSKSLIAAAGIPVVESLIATSSDEAADIAATLLRQAPGVALKILSRDISHKSDVDGVRLDLASPAGVREAADAMLQRVRERRPDAHIDGFTLAPMIRRPHAHELILGMSVDENFGPMLLFGAGGTAAEILSDTALALPPLDRDSALELIAGTRIARLLAGYRDKPAANLIAIADALVALCNLVTAHDELREIDINPLLADVNGVIALDARVRIASLTDAPRQPMVIRPYPAGWEKRLLIEGVGGVHIRPIIPADEGLYEAFIADIRPEDYRLRFFMPKSRLAHRFIARFTQIDYAREIAFVALDMQSGALLGVVRFAADPDYRRGEYAVLVRSHLKGKGLGWQLMSHLIDYARAHGLEELFGSVLSENSTMLRMCQQLGFRIAPDASDPTLRTVELKLTREAHAG